MKNKNAVVFTVTGSHIQLTGTALASLCRYYTSSEHLDVLIIASGISSSDIDWIRRIPTLYHRDNIYVAVWEPPLIANQIDSGKTSARFPGMTYWRLFAPSYFSEFDTILYVDNDVLFYQDVSKVLSLVPADHSIAAVPDFYFHAAANDSEMAQRLGIDTSQNYVNSGMILFNVAEFNRQFPATRILQAINTNDFLYPDQSILNQLTAKSITRLPLSYNYQKDDQWLHEWARENTPDQYPEFVNARDHVFIRHFVQFGDHSLPWQHLAINDPWEADWWTTLQSLKTRIGAFQRNA